MSKTMSVYAKGDMIVHHLFGVGKIVAIESKDINGVVGEYFKVKTETSTFWFSTEVRDNPRIHPVASKERIQEMIDILRSPPIPFSDDPLEWKTRFQDVQSSGDILEMSGLVRDLNALKRQNKLTYARGQALDAMEIRLLKEWAASLNIDAKELRPDFNAYLNESKNNNASEFDR